MSTDLGVGDAESPYLIIAPAAGDTTATLEVRPPVGDPYTVNVAGGPLEAITGSTDKQQRWTTAAPVSYDQAGRWVLHWAVTGTGESVEDLEVFVVPSPVAGGPTWAPGRSRVANYVPHRTLVRSTGSVIASQDGYEFTFTSDTRPSGVQVDRLIADGVDWVTAMVNPLNTKSQAACALLAALWAAVAVERSWPDDEQSLQRANDMEKRLDTMLAGVIKANTDANAADGSTYPPVTAVSPVWSFPPPDLRYDDARYW